MTSPETGEMTGPDPGPATGDVTGAAPGPETGDATGPNPGPATGDATGPDRGPAPGDFTQDGTRPRLILGSGSPRRRELLAQIGVTADAVRPPDIDETPAPGELPRDYCRRIARDKARAIAAGPDEIVLSADTTVALGRRILGKPADAAEAGAFLRALSGRRHRVVTAVALRRGDLLWERDTVTIVQMKPLSAQEIAAYLSTGDWDGKAGGYSIQGPAGAFVPWIRGSYPGVVGLPLAETAGLLRAAGYNLPGVSVPQRAPLSGDAP